MVIDITEQVFLKELVLHQLGKDMLVRRWKLFVYFIKLMFII